jgi:pimeloyl-ACP methyl ester carboxylesterase
MTTMNALGVATSEQETPVFFPAGADTLFGVLTEPIGEPRGTAAMLLVGGGSIATNRNRLFVPLARRLSAEGFHALRLDYHGVGESTGVLARAPRVSEPFLVDLQGAVDRVREAGADRLLLIGSCFGARTALSAAPELAGVEAVVLISPPLRDLAMDEEVGTRLAYRVKGRLAIRRAMSTKSLRGWRDPAARRTYLRFLRVKARMLWRLPTRVVRRGADDSWVSRALLEPIQALARQGVPVLLIFGTRDYHYDDFLIAQPGRLGRVLKGAPRTELVVLEGPVHGFPRVDVQERVLDVIYDWIERVLPRRSDDRSDRPKEASER